MIYNGETRKEKASKGTKASDIKGTSDLITLTDWKEKGGPTQRMGSKREENSPELIGRGRRKTKGTIKAEAAREREACLSGL